jgi:ATP-dependent DNA helicase PIF1
MAMEGLTMGKLDNIYEQGTEGIVPVRFISGSAGTGKTYYVHQKMAEDPKFAILASTTGISAVNLGAITINSLLHYFNTPSLEEAFYNGWLLKTLGELAKDDYQWLAVDEVSMMDGDQLDIIYQATKMLNESRAMAGLEPLGILLTGDFAQLPPIKAKWAFEAECWPVFEAATERLTKVWRQTDIKFIEAVNHIRAGRGMVGATMLSQMGVEFTKHIDNSFVGTTIIAKNEPVNNFNWLRHSRLPGVPTYVTSSRWMTKGRQFPKEWEIIPNELKLKVGAYVMIKANDAPTFSYVNGDCGHVVAYDNDPDSDSQGLFTIRLVRNDLEVQVGKLTRKVAQKEPPEELLLKHPGMAEDDLKELDGEPNMPHWDPDYGRNGAWIVGAITFYPVDLAYACTVHKTQSLTLDKVQIDLGQNFMSSNSMVYVAVSRCKSPQGLRIVGTPALMGSRVHSDPAIQRWL